MLWEILLAITLGMLAGTLTGITPGIHVNLIATLLISASLFLINYVSEVTLSVFIIAMAVTHTFLDIIPAIFLGAPDADMALSVLPGHKYLLKGNAMIAIKLTLIGSFGALLISILLFPLFYLIIHIVYPLIQNLIVYFLIVIVLFMTLKEKNKLIGLAVFFLSGILGLIVFNSNISNPLFPILSGLFGISTLIISIKRKTKIPMQKSKKIKLNKLQTGKALLVGQFAGFITAVFPGIGASIAALIGMQLIRKIKDYQFMVLLGSVNTTNFILSIATLLVLGKARNGAIVAVFTLIQGFTLFHILVFLSTALIAGTISVFITIKAGLIFCNIINKINYQKLAIFVIGLIVILSFFLSSWQGFLVLVSATLIGIIPIITKTRRTHAMGCILLPVIISLLS